MAIKLRDAEGNLTSEGIKELERVRETVKDKVYELRDLGVSHAEVDYMFFAEVDLCNLRYSRERRR
ncbi:tail fibers protein [Listeria virus P61]|nr:tail fibers protein [Listeria virus P61]